MQSFTEFWKTCKRQLSARTFRQGMFSLALIALVLAIVIALNVLFSTLPSIYTSFDLTEKKTSEELSDTTKDYLTALRRDITVYYLVVPGSEDARTLRILERYAALSSHLHIEQINPDLYPDFAATQGITEELEEGSLIVKSDLRTKAIKFSDYYIEVLSLPVLYGVLLCEGEQAYIELQNALAQLPAADRNTILALNYGQYKQMAGQSIPEVIMNLETELTTTIDYVNLESLSTIYQVTGHGEIPLSEAMLKRFTAENVSIASLSLIDGIPASCDSLLICAPTENYAAQDLSALKTFLQKGGRLILLAGDPAKAPDLYALLATEYGVTQKAGVVYDSARSVMLSGTQLAKPLQQPHEGIQSILGGSYTVLLSRPGALTIAEKKDVKVTPLLTSSDKAFLRTSTATGMTKQEGDVEGTYHYAVTIEKAVGDKTTQIVWFSTESILNSTCNNASSNGNYRYFLSSALWNVDQFGSITMDTASLSYISILAVPQPVATTWLVILAVVIPLAILTLGVVRTTKRRVR